MENGMNTLKTPYVRATEIGLLLLVLSFCAVASAATKTPPIPKEPISDLKMPAPLVDQVVEGKASLSPTTRLGFALDLDREVLVGDWKVEGRVTAVDAQKMTFTTADGKEANLVFRWPKEFEMPLGANELVTVHRTAQPYQGAMEDKVSIERDGGLAVNYGRVFGAEPKQILLSEDVKIEQTKDFGSILSDSKYETTRQIPVVFIAEGRSVLLEPGKTQQIRVAGAKFKVLISKSIHVAPTPAFEGVAEGSGYVLEYVLTLE